MKRQYKKIASSENQIVIAYTKPNKTKSKLLDTQFLNYTKTLSNKKNNGFSTNNYDEEYNIPEKDAPI